ncbi:hypothetical protein [Lacticaseibacillus camelliae]|uniref:hypothetical protein n=1 Tax=Lacticaseibacillus camelliae TaxID=381742 RepID=UPI0009E6DDFD|nr:hypothetical protein [Lacticaseibacillus camelliae]
MAEDKVLTAQAEAELRKPIDDAVGKIQAEVNELRKDGTDQVISLNSHIEAVKRDKSLSKAERDAAIEKDKQALVGAKQIEAKNKDQVSKLVSEAESYIKAHFDKEYYQPLPRAVPRKRSSPKRLMMSKWPAWSRSTKQPSSSFLIAARSKRRIMFIRTNSLTRK